MIVVRWLKREAFILAELNSLVQQNKVVAFRVISCLVCRKIVFGNKVQVLLNMLKISLDDLEKNLVVEEMSNKDTLVNSSD